MKSFFKNGKSRKLIHNYSCPSSLENSKQFLKANFKLSKKLFLHDHDNSSDEQLFGSKVGTIGKDGVCPKLEQVLACRKWRDDFRNFLKSEYSEENIDFWIEVEDFKNVSHSYERCRCARGIFETYIQPAAFDCVENLNFESKELNLDSWLKKIIVHQYQQCQKQEHMDIDIFDRAQVHVYQLMARDSYPRFCKSRGLEPPRTEYLVSKSNSAEPVKQYQQSASADRLHRDVDDEFEEESKTDRNHNLVKMVPRSPSKYSLPAPSRLRKSTRASNLSAVPLVYQSITSTTSAGNHGFSRASSSQIEDRDSAGPMLSRRESGRRSMKRAFVHFGNRLLTMGSRQRANTAVSGQLYN